MSTAPRSCSTRSAPSMTTVYSSNSGRWPGSAQPSGDCIRATLRRSSCVLTRPTNSSISLGFVPAASTRLGDSMSSGTVGVEGGLERALDVLERLRPVAETPRDGDPSEERADRGAGARHALRDLTREVEHPLDGLLVGDPAALLGNVERGRGLLRPVVERAFHGTSPPPSRGGPSSTR